MSELADWSDPATRPLNGHGVKARIGPTPALPYSDWRRTVGNGCYANDVDWVEWRMRDGEPVPVAIIETTFYDDIPAWRYKLPLYRQAALDRFKRDGQSQIVRVLADRLGIRAYLAIVRKDLAWFIVCRLADECWREMSEPDYRAWILRLGGR